MRISELIKIIKNRIENDLDNIPDYLDSNIYWFPESHIKFQGLIDIKLCGFNDDNDLVLSNDREIL